MVWLNGQQRSRNKHKRSRPKTYKTNKTHKNHKKSRRKLKHNFGLFKWLTSKKTDEEKSAKQLASSEKPLTEKRLLKRTKKKLEEIKYELNNTKLNFVITVGGFILLLFYAIYSNLDITNTQDSLLRTANYLFLFLGGQHLTSRVISGVITNPLNKTTRKIYYKAVGIPQDKLLTHYQTKYKTEIAPLKNTSVDKFFNKMFDNIKFHVRSIEKKPYDEEHSVSRIDDLFKNVDLVFDLVSDDTQLDFKSELDSTIYNIEQFLGSYPDVKETLLTSAIKPFVQNMLAPYKIPVSSIFIWGQPGTGKSSFIHKLASILDVSVLEYQPPQERRRYRNHDKEVTIDDLSSIAKLIYKAKTETGRADCILYFDEIDKKILNRDRNNEFKLEELLNLTGDMANKTYYEEDLGINIPITNMLIVCTSNLSIDELIAKDNRCLALKRRFIEINFPDIDKALQLKIITNYLKNLYTTKNVLYTDADEQFFTKIVALTNFTGMGELISGANIYMSNKIGQSSFSGTQWASMLMTPEQLINIIGSGPKPGDTPMIEDDRSEYN